MRIVAWNCQMAFHKKHQYLSELRPDIAVIPECANPEIIKGHCPEFTFNDCDWAGANKHKGLAVFAFNDITLNRDDCFDSRFSQYIPLKAKVANKSALSMLAIWSFNKRRKIKGINEPTIAAFEHYASFLESSNAIAAGDFNNCPAFDKPSRKNKMSNTVAFMQRCGLKSAYHSFNKCNLGDEAEPTHFWRKGEKEYHIDYCFVPSNSSIQNVRVGDRNQWIEHSDHAPLIVDLKGVQTRQTVRGDS